jgi:Domain of unknown function (DUF1844)
MDGDDRLAISHSIPAFSRVACDAVFAPMPETPDNPKIIVDEDWKSQVETERQAARQRSSTSPSSPDSLAPGSAGGSERHASPAPELPDAPLPPPSLTFLFTTLATQAMIALGQVPNPITGKVDVRLHQAKHYIDTLGLLEEKTTGHRSIDESALLSELLHQLRMAFVLMQNQGTHQ